ncbi:MAG TPA: hypothetical protein VK961_15665, partial [Chthoniobacter sp.]|nr:hypothetical protein [Chthoniobacter sp.]
TNGGPGQFTYSGMNFTVDKWLKGKCPKSLVVKVKISYGYEEENPILGTKYVVFVFKAPGENFLRAVKMLPADSVTIREVRDAISSVRLATPPPKPAQGTLLPGIPGLIQ